MLDQIKDSGRFVVDVAQNSEYYFYEITLTENQNYYTPWLNLQGKARVAYEYYNFNTSPGSVTVYIEVSPFSDGSSNITRLATTVNAASTSSGDIVIPAQFMRFRVASGSNTGNYTVRIWVAVHPVS